ncbi:T3SS effector HopA1 family protein [Undibacterium flavidum]|uniref:Uncharacterized protein n=1 Tax=Undibacterium flavidum TaxID=2762297 RepID=A0ABR6Y6X3_9BURK|nr:T3SS effector HopA1 family protein [Undibacterium flavidum]MBC3872352.1 hypothetical protein [Undibacterium flavidum]
MKRDSILRQQLTTICQRVSITSPNAYVFDGVTYTFDAPAIASPEKETENTDVNQLREHLNSKFYDECYVGHFLSDADPESVDVKYENLTNLFHAANDNKDGWDPGWRIYETGSDGRVFVQKADRSRVAIAGEYSTYKWPGVAPTAGDFVSIRMFAGTTDVQPSFFFAFGRTLSDQFDENALVRFYFNVAAHAAVDLMAQITSTLNRYHIPFKFKSLVQTKMYTRADSAVLYVARRYYTLVASLIIDMHKGSAIRLREGIPLFTRCLVSGVGMAEDFKARTSFGMHRCGLVAEGIVQAYLAGERDVEVQVDMIEQVFQANDICIERPYLNPNSNDIFGQAIFDKETQW